MPDEATFLLELDGMPVIRVERLEDGIRRVRLAAAQEAARALPDCGAFAWKVKGTARIRPRDLPYGSGGLVLLWHKRRWWCREPKCPRKRLPRASPRYRPGRGSHPAAPGGRVLDADSPVQAAGDLHLSWPKVMRAFRASAREVVDVPLPEMKVLGVNEIRRGTTKWGAGPRQRQVAPDRDLWHTGFVDTLGHGGVLGQVEGRTVADLLAWLSTTSLTWRRNITHVAIDMSATYRAAIRNGLPDAIVVFDHFHVVQLATKCCPWSGATPPPDPRPTRTDQ
ncbi:ISL3 family transposase ISMsm4 [Streptomyces sp. enrichment culture]|uniref:transposase n=1 Tax=Streptomyces sp. enrichment culture TaxID=1795815 RepID=UPI003F550E14